MDTEPERIGLCGHAIRVVLSGVIGVGGHALIALEPDMSRIYIPSTHPASDRIFRG